MGGPVASLLLLDAETGARSELTNKDEAGLLGFSVTGKFTADQQAILLNVWGSDFHGIKRLSLAADGLGADGLGASKLTNLLAGENIRDQLLSMDGQFLFTIHEDLTLRMWRVDELGQAEGESAHP
jgi:hypothetical protein